MTHLKKARQLGSSEQFATFSATREHLGRWKLTKTILVVDDDLATLKLVGLVLDQKGYDVVTARSGEEALERARLQNPDLIVLDIMMPGMDGYEVVQHLRADPSTARLPILMLTAKSDLDDQITGFEVGADDYLTKPFHREELVSRVESVLHLAEGRQAPPQPL